MKNLYCVVDLVNKEWGPVLIMNNDEAAERMFRSEVDKISSEIVSSLVLYRIGTFNPEFRTDQLLDVLTPICSETFGSVVISGSTIVSEDVEEIADES